MIYEKKILSLYDNKAVLDSKGETRMSLRAVAYTNSAVCYNIVYVGVCKSPSSTQEIATSTFYFILFTSSYGSGWTVVS